MSPSGKKLRAAFGTIVALSAAPYGYTVRGGRARRLRASLQLALVTAHSPANTDAA